MNFIHCVTNVNYNYFFLAKLQKMLEFYTVTKRRTLKDGHSGAKQIGQLRIQPHLSVHPK